MSKVAVRRARAELDQTPALTQAPEFQKVTWYKEPHLRKLYAMSLVLMIASSTTGYDGSLINISQQMQQWQDFFGDEIADNNKLGVLVNIFNIGSIVSFFITPHVADTFGRKAAIVFGCVFMVGGGCLTAFCNGYAMYIAGRFALGFGNSLSQMASPLLLTEICHPQHRGPVTAIYNCLWNFGALLVCSIGWGTAYIGNDWSWRSITLVQIVPSVMQLVFIWWLPESPRFLVHQDRNEEALLVLAKHHAGGNMHDAVVQFEYLQVKQTIQMDRDTDTATSYLDFVRTSGNRRRLAIIMSLGVISQYSGNALFSNYMNTIYAGAGITSPNQKLAMSTGKTLLDLAVTIGAALNVDRFGRRPLFLISTTGMVAAFACWTATGAVYEESELTNVTSGYAQLVFIWVFGIFYDVGFSGLLVAYALEILPFHLRAKGMMIMNITVQAVLAMGNQTNKIAWDSFPKHWHFMLFYTLWDVAQLIFVWVFYVETKGPTLEEIARIFDGKDAVAHIDLHEIAKGVHGSCYHGGGGDDDDDDDGGATYGSYMPQRGSAARRYYSERHRF
ncbi:general substrate transporter [Coniella lustricola]|uniref:General substrate transporter n=1 Tax=Coniella lustricola TaxID=2025994 RepID=A0A2T2ZWC8_9PEZI|nr:general substrate transporter [Coniella lustricola]